MVLMDKICPSCKSPIMDDNQRFCEGCGMELIKSEKIKCNNCGEEVREDGQQFCFTCGKKIVENPANKNNNDGKNKKILVSKQLLAKLIKNNNDLEKIQVEENQLPAEAIVVEEGTEALPDTTSDQAPAPTGNKKSRFKRKDKPNKNKADKNDLIKGNKGNQQNKTDTMKVLAPIAKEIKEDIDFRRKLQSLFDI